jgi:hypothetical protein
MFSQARDAETRFPMFFVMTLNGLALFFRSDFGVSMIKIDFSDDMETEWAYIV